jgi:hypothetical protein
MRSRVSTQREAQRQAKARRATDDSKSDALLLRYLGAPVYGARRRGGEPSGPGRST